MLKKDEVRITRRCNKCGKRKRHKAKTGNDGMLNGSGIIIHGEHILIPFRYVCQKCVDADIIERAENDRGEMN